MRLELVRLFRNSQKKEIIIPLKKYSAQNVDTSGCHPSGLQSCICDLLHGIERGHPNYPEVAVIGMAGALVDNVFMKSVNLPKWD